MTRVSDGLSPATHLAIGYATLNLIHEFRHNLGVLVASHVTCIPDAIRCVSELVFDPLQGAREDSTSD